MVIRRRKRADVVVQTLEALRVLGDGLADAADHVGEEAELLQDGVVRNGAQLARMLQVDVPRPGVVLAPRRTRPGGVQEVGAIGPEQGAVRRIVHDGAVEALDRGEEFLGVVGLGIERIVALRRERQRVLENAAQRGQRAVGRDERQIAVAALKAHLLLVAHAEPGECGARGGRVHVRQAIRQALGVAAAAHRFAVGVEDDQFDVVQSPLGEHAADRDAQPLDRVGGRDLPEIAAGIREAGLDVQAALATDVGAKAVHGERLGDRVGAPLQADPGLEQRRDLDLVLDAEQLREVERGQQGEAGFALGDQKADRLARVDVLEGLRDDHEQAFGGRLLRSERAEVDLHRHHAVDQPADRVEVSEAVARIVGRVIHADGLADRIVQLPRIQSDVGVGETEPERRDPGA